MRNLILFFVMVITMYLYSYILGGETSMIMVYMLIFSPLVSILLIFPARNRIAISIDAPSSEVEKGGIIRVNVHIDNKSFVPFPFINIKFCDAVNFSVSGSTNQIVSVGPFQTKTITVEYTAKSRGVSEIGVSDIWLKDYLNLFRLSILKNSDYDRFTGEVTVLPRLVNIKPTSKILLGSLDSLQQDDLATASTSFFCWNGEPGYEFREYMAGDPLHKVHWKLSARSETLIVRKDEGRGVSKKRLVLDPYIKKILKKQVSKTIYQLLFNYTVKPNEPNYNNIEDEILGLEEKILEAILAVAHISVKTAREVELWLCEDGKWSKYGLPDGKSINEIQHRLASYIFNYDLTSDFSKRLPLSEILEHEGVSRYLQGGELTVFSCHFDETLQKAIDSFSDYGLIVDTVSIKSSASNMKISSKEEKAFIHRKGNAWVLGIDDDITEALS